MSNCSVESGRNEITKFKFRYEGFPGGSMVKNLPANAGDTGSIPGLRRTPEEGNDNSSSILDCEIHGHRRLASYSPWGHKKVRHDLATKQQQTFLQYI